MISPSSKGMKIPSSPVVTLKRRSEFQRIRRGARWAGPAFVLEAKPRDDTRGASSSEQPRFGFTVTRQVGGAIVRNRIKRRLKAAVRRLQGQHARRDFDYVLIARRAAFDAAFDVLLSDLSRALDRVNRGNAPKHGAPR